MSVLDAQRLDQLLQSGKAPLEKLSPVYLLFGEESYLIQNAIHKIKTIALSQGAADFNFDVYYAADCDIGVVKDVVETLPMMSPRRLVLLNEVQDLKESEWNHLEKLFMSPPPESVFILAGRKVDKRKKSFKVLSELATVVEFKKPYENQMPSWIRYICKMHELEITEEAVQLFYKLVGNNLTEIDAETAKLKLYIGDRKLVEMQDVALSVSRSKEDSIFELTEAIGKNDRLKALIHLIHLLDQGQNALGIVAMISRNTRILLQIKQGLELGFLGPKLAQYVQIPVFTLQNYVDQSRIWSQRRLEQSLLSLAEADKALKSSPLSAHIWLENLILKMCPQQK
jgi:DNA polymerase-3 subunit delta